MSSFPEKYFQGGAMATQREKTVGYRRAEWFDQGTAAPPLEKCLRQALGQLKTIDERTIVRGGSNVKVAKQQDAYRGGLLLHLATETPGEAASVVPKVVSTAIELDLRTQSPPNDGEWLDGDAFVLVHDDHVCLCTTGMHESAVATFFYHLFEKAKVPPNFRDFILLKAVDITRLTMLQRQGVQEIEIRGSLYKVTADYVHRQTHVPGILGLLGKEVKRQLGKPHDVTQDSLRVAINIKLDKRQRSRLSIGEKDLQTLAEDLIKNVEDDDDYTIITGDNQKITPKEIFVKTKALIEADGKTVGRDKAWQELILFYHSLLNAGVLAQ
jgi:hypothetical protein